MSKSKLTQLTNRTNCFQNIVVLPLTKLVADYYKKVGIITLHFKKRLFSISQNKCKSCTIKFPGHKPDSRIDWRSHGAKETTSLNQTLCFVYFVFYAALGELFMSQRPPDWQHHIVWILHSVQTHLKTKTKTCRKVVVLRFVNPFVKAKVNKKKSNKRVYTFETARNGNG